MNFLKKLISALCFVGAVITGGQVSGAQANLIENGSFENILDDQTRRSGSSWNFYSSLPSWESSKSIEIWNDNFIVDAYDGSNVLELNSKSNGTNDSFTIFQDFSTVIGEIYELTFAGRKRSENSDEAFSVSVGNLSESIYNQTWGDWNEYSFFFIADSTSSTLTFTSLDGAYDTTGNLFDAVSVINVTEKEAIPEPGILMLMVLAIVGLFVSRKKLS